MISAALSSDTIAEANGIEVQSGSPILALCRRLLSADHDPASTLEAYRGDTLCLTIRSIGEAARLRANTHGVGFIRRGNVHQPRP